MKRILGLLTLGLLAACSSGGGGSGSGGGTGGSGGSSSSGGGSGNDKASACKTYGAAICDYYARCPQAGQSQWTDFSIYKTAAECADKWVNTCEQDVFRPGTVYTPADVTACAGTFANLACTTNPAFNCPLKLGTKAEGASCGFGDECASGSCAAATNTCGTCIPPRPADGSCLRATDCGVITDDPYWVCDTGKCKRIVVAQLNDSCNAANIQCPKGSSCRNDKCTAQVGVGSTCGINDGTVGECQPQFKCEAPLDAGLDRGTCTAWTVVPDGQQCDWTRNDSRYCPYGTECRNDNPDGGSYGLDGGFPADTTCQPLVMVLKAGDACNQLYGFECGPGLVCDGPTQTRTCQIRQPALKTCN